MMYSRKAGARTVPKAKVHKVRKEVRAIRQGVEVREAIVAIARGDFDWPQPVWSPPQRTGHNLHHVA